MIEIVGGPEVAHKIAQWVIDRCGEDGLTPQALGAFQAYGVMKDKKAVAGVIFNWFREMDHGNDMRVIIAADDPSWCLPGVLRELFRYPYEFAGCQRLTAVIRDGNKRSIRLCRGLGFQKEGVLRRGYDGRTNALIMGMLKNECKWIRPRAHRGAATNGHLPGRGTGLDQLRPPS